MQRARRAKLIRRMVLVGVLALSLFLVVRQFQDVSGPDEIRGHEISRFRDEGENQHTGDAVNYETTPPVAGEHRPSPPDCGIYGTQMEDELLVHGLEHGAVAVLYQPTLALEDIRRIEEIAGEYDSHVITMPYEGMEPVVAVASWGERMDLQELDAPAVRTYIDEFRDEGPEAGQSCDMEEDTPFEPAEATPAPGGSPSPEPT